MDYESLLSAADKEGLIVKERPFRTYDGRIKGNNIYLRKGMTLNEKSCVLAEELGHHYTSVGNILDMSVAENRKQEQQARLWAYDKMIGLPGIIKAYKARRIESPIEMADYLDVTEEFLMEALNCYKSKYGQCVRLGHYYIMFDTLAVIEKYD